MEDRYDFAEENRRTPEFWCDECPAWDSEFECCMATAECIMEES